jgi:hypothetical protein
MSNDTPTARPRRFSSEGEIFALRPVVGWTLFSLTAGYVNAGAFMACRNFVTHVTGTVTSAAMGGTDASIEFQPVLILVAFLVGAILAVLTSETLRARPRAAFAAPILFVMGMLVLTAIAGRAGAFGDFGGGSEGPSTQALVASLAVAMGSLNAAVAVATSNSIRVTHLTGPVTDLAGNLVRAVLRSGADSVREFRWAMLRTIKVLAFGTGALFAAKYASHLMYDTFVAGAAMLALALRLTTFDEERTASGAWSVGRTRNASPSTQTADRNPAGDIAARP